MIGVVTDSSSDLPRAIRDELGIAVVPLTVRFGIETFLDGFDLDHDQFWSRLRSSRTLPEITAPGAGAFVDAFDRVARSEVEEVVVVTLSSRLSGTHQAAVMAAEAVAPRLRVRVVDSHSVSMGLGLAVIAAAETAAGGGDLAAVAASAYEAARATEFVAIPATVEFLERGGRLHRIQALMATALDLRPVLTVRDGVVAADGRARTRSGARSEMARRAAGASDGVRLSVIDGAATDIDEFVDAVETAVGHEVLVAGLGPVVGTHAGPGTVGLAYQRV
jgi:DegV family protein with EDD domain